MTDPRGDGPMRDLPFARELEADLVDAARRHHGRKPRRAVRRAAVAAAMIAVAAAIALVVVALLPDDTGIVVEPVAPSELPAEAPSAPEDAENEAGLSDVSVAERLVESSGMCEYIVRGLVSGLDGTHVVEVVISSADESENVLEELHRETFRLTADGAEGFEAEPVRYPSAGSDQEFRRIIFEVDLLAAGPDGPPVGSERLVGTNECPPA